MLTLEKLKIYKSFRGDIDSFGRSLNRKTKEKITESEFNLIDELVQEAIVIRNNLASDLFRTSFETKVSQSFGGNYNACEELFNDIIDMQVKKIKDIFGNASK